jgi:hypothetical protein
VAWYARWLPSLIASGKTVYRRSRSTAQLALIDGQDWTKQMIERIFRTVTAHAGNRELTATVGEGS